MSQAHEASQRGRVAHRGGGARLLLALVALMLVAAGCGAKGDSVAETGGGSDGGTQVANGGDSGGQAALEAQAVAARSYAYARLLTRGTPQSRPWCWWW